MQNEIAATNRLNRSESESSAQSFSQVEAHHPRGKLNAWIRDFFNAGRDPASISPWELRRLRYINIVLLMLVFVGAAYAWGYSLLGMVYSPPTIAVCALASAATMVVLRNTGNISLSGNLATLALYIAVVVSLYELGGLYTSAFGWLIVLPMLGGWLVGLKGCLYWSGIVALTIFGLWIGHLLDVIPPPLPEPLYIYQSFAADMGALLVTCVICVGFLTQTEDAEARAQKTIASLDEEVAVRRQAETEARTAVEVRSRFLAMMSHEIRTPLNGMLGMSRLLEDTPLNEDQHELLRTSLGAGETLLTVLNDVLDFSKLDANSVSVEHIAFPLHLLVKELVTLNTASATAKNLALVLDYAEGLPEWVEGDPTRLRQILGNLLTNAIKFTEQGSITLAVREDENKHLEFAVTDTGIGIPEAAQQNLFEPFTQAESATTRRFGGTGLGLTISSQLIELMGGQMHLESIESKGSRFWFTLPLTAAAAPASESNVATSHDRHALRILVAEDNATNQKLVRLFLERSGHLVTVVENGEQAVEQASSGEWDLILMDMQMPIMDGLEATRRIRATLGDSLPIVALTANAMAEDREKCVEAGMGGFLTKPLKFNEIDALLERWIPGSSTATS